jgi:hypothetical protein
MESHGSAEHSLNTSLYVPPDLFTFSVGRKTTQADFHEFLSKDLKCKQTPFSVLLQD